LLTSQGVPMILMGDEIGRTQQGNNNTYCHDNELNWMDWKLAQKNADLFRFFKACIQFRKAHPVLRRGDHFQYYDTSGWGYPDISFHGTQAWHPDWSENSRILAFLLCSKQTADDFIYVAANSYWEGLELELPQLPEGKKWHVFANTGMPTPLDVSEVGNEPVLDDQGHFLMGPRSTIILTGR
jgi:isoamylase